jgi:DNA-binding NtrC family response regulator
MNKGALRSVASKSTAGQTAEAGSERATRPVIRLRDVSEVDEASTKLKAVRDLAVALVGQLDALGGLPSLTSKSSIDLKNEVRTFETRLISWALERTGGNQRRAAQILGVKHSTLNAKLRVLRINPFELKA